MGRQWTTYSIRSTNSRLTSSERRESVDPTSFLGVQPPVDIDGLRKFHHHLQRGLYPAASQPSPLRFVRHRWVSADGPSDIEIVETPRPRAELDAWLKEQATAPIDAEHGPEWHLAVLPFTDGGAAVSLAVSHNLADGVGCRRRWRMRRIAATPRSAGRPLGRAGGGRRCARMPVKPCATFRLSAAAPLPRHGWPGARRGGAGAAPSTRGLRLPAAADEPLTPPMATVFVDAGEREARAHALGGTSNALLAGLAAHLAQRMGRVTADGSGPEEHAGQ